MSKKIALLVVIILFFGAFFIKLIDKSRVNSSMLFDCTFMEHSANDSDKLKMSINYDFVLANNSIIIHSNNRDKIYIASDTILNDESTSVDTSIILYFYLSKFLLDKDKVFTSVPYSYGCFNKRDKCKFYHCEFDLYQKTWVARVSTFKGGICHLELDTENLNDASKGLKGYSKFYSTALTGEGYD